MRFAQRATTVFLVPLALAAAAPSRAATPPDAAGAGAVADERSKLVLRIDGELGQEREGALAGLLGAELAQNRVTLSVERSSESRLGWTSTARRDPRALMLAILDVRDERAWALYIVDAARGRAILRRLPGGVEANAAALEEVAAILTSAVAAVREGLEVASKPVEVVVADQPEAERPRERRARPPAASSTAPPAERALTSEREEPKTAASTAFARPFAAAFARGSTLAGHFVPGAAAELGLGLGPHARVLVHGAMDRRARLSTPLGAFELGRSLAALEGGYARALGPVTLEPRAGGGAEIVRRSATTAAPGVAGTTGETHVRFAVFAGVRVRYVVAGPLAVEVGADATLAPRPLRFTSGETVLASVPPLSAGAVAGIVIGGPD